MANLVSEPVEMCSYDDSPGEEENNAEKVVTEQPTGKPSATKVAKIPLAPSHNIPEKKRGPSSEPFGEGSSKQCKIGTVIGVPITNKDIPEGSLVSDLKEAPIEDMLLPASDVLRYAAGKIPAVFNKLRLAKEKATKSAKDADRRATLAESQSKKNAEVLRTHRKFGALNRNYPSLVVKRFLKTKDFENMFKTTTRIAHQLGQSEALRARVAEHLELTQFGFPSVGAFEKCIAKDKDRLKKAFEDSVRDENCKFACTEHLRKMTVLPTLDDLQAIRVDYNDSLPAEMAPLEFPKSGTTSTVGEVPAGTSHEVETPIVDTNEKRREEQRDGNDANMR